MAWKLTVNRQKRLILYRQLSKMQVKMKRQKSSKYLILTTSPDKHGIPAPEEFLNWKNQFPCSQKHFF